MQANCNVYDGHVLETAQTIKQNINVQNKTNRPYSTHPYRKTHYDTNRPYSTHPYRKTLSATLHQIHHLPNIPYSPPSNSACAVQLATNPHPSCQQPPPPFIDTSPLILRGHPCSSGAVEEEVIPSWFLQELWEQHPVENRLFTDVRIGEKRFRALIDTGATRTFVGPRVQECLKEYVIETSGSIKVADGKISRTSGCVAIKFESRGVGCILPVRITPILSYDVILGMDFITDMGVEIRGKKATWGVGESVGDTANDAPIVDATPMRIEGAVAIEENEVSQGEMRDPDEAANDVPPAQSQEVPATTLSPPLQEPSPQTPSDLVKASETPHHPSSPTARSNRSSKGKVDLKGRRTDHYSRQKRSSSSSKTRRDECNTNRAISLPPPPDPPSTVTNIAIQPLMSIVFPPDYNPFPHRTSQPPSSLTIPPLMSIPCTPPADYRPRWDYRVRESPRRTRRVVRTGN